MRLNQLLKNSGLRYRLKNFKDFDVKGIAYDSRDVQKDFLFVAKTPEYIEDAIKRGAKAIVTDRELPYKITQIIAGNPRRFLSRISKVYYNRPDEKMKVIGITGTNGKTTTSFLIKSIFDSAGYKTGLIGTIEYLIGDKKIEEGLTTPESLDIYRIMDKMVKEKVDVCIMEVSSHGLSQCRVEDVDFDVAVLTEIGRDHLDYHKTFRNYLYAKAKLFKLLEEGKLAVLNKDCEYFDFFKRFVKSKLITYGRDGDVRGKIIEMKLNGMKVEIEFKKEKYSFDVNLTGDYNLYNIMASFCVGAGLNISIDKVIEGIRSLKGVRGRFEVIGNVVIDFAHTPDALFNFLSALRKLNKGKLVCVFGAGGERDPRKRPLMGKVAEEIADFVIVTSDNPRREDPRKIIKDILKGMKKENHKVIEDRREAIEYAIKMAGKEDIVAICGKGHEQYQIIGDKKILFDERKIVESLLKRRGYG